MKPVRSSAASVNDLRIKIGQILVYGGAWHWKQTVGAGGEVLEPRVVGLGGGKLAEPPTTT